MNKSIRFLPIIYTFVIVSYAFGQTDSFTPIPLSENAEQTSSCSIEFLSYPKYYYNEEGDLTPVVTDLVSSNDPDWDYEVTTGIWSLRVRNDGTYQASHKGRHVHLPSHRSRNRTGGRVSFAEFRIAELGAPIKSSETRSVGVMSSPASIYRSGTSTISSK